MLTVCCAIFMLGEPRQLKTKHWICLGIVERLFEHTWHVIANRDPMAAVPEERFCSAIVASVWMFALTISTITRKH